MDLATRISNLAPDAWVFCEGETEVRIVERTDMCGGKYLLSTWPGNYICGQTDSVKECVAFLEVTK